MENSKLEKYKKIKEELMKSTSLLSDEEHSKEIKALSAIAAFQASDYKASNIELAQITGISKSSIQRYLTDQKLVESIAGPETFVLIKNAIITKKTNASIKGGLNAFKNNIALKDKQGKFTGKFIKRTPVEEDVVDKKTKDILLLVGRYLKEDTSINELARETGYTKDYVFDCLTNSQIVDMLGIDIAKALTTKLANNYPENIKKSK